MEKIKVIVDSGSDISLEDSLEYNIGVVPCNYIMDGKTTLDFIDFNSKEFCHLLRTEAEIPTTSQPSPDEYCAHYNQYAEDGYDHVIVITMSHHGSGSFNCAMLAKDIFDEEKKHCQVHVIDSWSCSLNQVFEAKLASEMINENKTIDEILEKLDTVRRSLGTYYLVDNIDFLIKGGRVSTLKGSIANKLKLKPIVSIKDGAGSNMANAMGYQNGLSKLVGFFTTEATENSTLYISHADCEDNAKLLVEKIQKVFPNLKYIIRPMLATMSVHSGPDALGIFYHKDK